MSTVAEIGSPVESPVESDPKMSTLGEIQQVSEGSPVESPVESAGVESAYAREMRHAIYVNKCDDVINILRMDGDGLTDTIADKGRKALHVAAMLGRVGIVEMLLREAPQQYCILTDVDGETALVLASRYGNYKVAKRLVDHDTEFLRRTDAPPLRISILIIPNKRDNIPVTEPFASGHKKLGRYLFRKTPLNCLDDTRGSRLLHYCIRAQCFDNALELFHKHNGLILEPINNDNRANKWMPIHDIAVLNTIITGPSEHTLWKRWIYGLIKLEDRSLTKKKNKKQEDRSQGPAANLIEQGGKKMQELRKLHKQARELLHLVCRNANETCRKEIIEKAFCLAAQEGNVQFVSEVYREVPEVFLSETLFLMCFNNALHNRQAGVFSFIIYQLPFKANFITVEEDANSIMHHAAKKASDHVLNRIYAPILQMQRELRWYKEVESLVPPGSRGSRNKKGLTAEELFREEHKELMKQGEKWIKATASSCSVVGALIVTIMFAAAFTIPGGNDQIHGYPLLVKQPFFKVFIFSTIFSLLSSSSSVLIFLAIFTSQYSEEMFLESLPRKLILGLFFLFISVGSMITAFLSTTYLMLQHTNYSWGLYPFLMLAIVPILLFVGPQLPLLLHTYGSTYGNIFDRNVRPWP